MDDDIVCPIGQEQRKLLLFDNHACFVEGEYIGQFENPETKNQLPQSVYAYLQNVSMVYHIMSILMI